MPPKVVKACCNECEKDVFNGDKALISTICEKWYHTKCQKVQNGDYEFLKNLMIVYSGTVICVKRHPKSCSK